MESAEFRPNEQIWVNRNEWTGENLMNQLVKTLNYIIKSSNLYKKIEFTLYLNVNLCNEIINILKSNKNESRSSFNCLYILENSFTGALFRSIIM